MIHGVNPLIVCQKTVIMMNEVKGTEPLYDPNDLTFISASELGVFDGAWFYKIDFSMIPFFERLKQILRFIIKGKMEFKLS